jgi:hypothetical protein
MGGAGGARVHGLRRCLPAEGAPFCKHAVIPQRRRAATPPGCRRELARPWRRCVGDTFRLAEVGRRASRRRTMRASSGAEPRIVRRWRILIPPASAGARRPLSVAATAGARTGIRDACRAAASMIMGQDGSMSGHFAGTPRAARTPVAQVRRAMTSGCAVGWPNALQAPDAPRPVPPPFARGPSPRPRACGWGCERSGRARRDAGALPARPWRGLRRGINSGCPGWVA